MSFTDFLTDLRQRDEDARVIFDHAEPVGRPTDLVMPRRRFLDRFRRKASAPAAPQVSAPNKS